MDFEMSAEHREAIAKARGFALKSLAPGSRDRANKGYFDRDLWRRAGKAGLTGFSIDPEHGGLGCDVLGTALVVEALAQNCEDLGLLFAICAHNFACVVPIWRAGSGEVTRRWLLPLARGTAIGAGAITEAEAGSDAFALTTTAIRTGDEFSITGRKRYVTNAPEADLIIVYARTGSAPGPFGISAFAVPSDTPGLRIESGPSKVGLSSAPWGSLVLDDCRVPAAALIGEPEAGAAIFQESMRWERVCLLALALGATSRTMDRCIAHVRSRKQFGKALGQFQAVSTKLVDMRVRLEASRWLLYHAAWLHSRNEPADEAIAISKIMSAESAVSAGLEAIQVFGAEGIIPDNGIDLFLRDMLPLRILSGTTEVQKLVVARFMGISK
jgi:alkylation response protein AidB-like acyl-CoA dehydrogenase